MYEPIHPIPVDPPAEVAEVVIIGIDPADISNPVMIISVADYEAEIEGLQAECDRARAEAAELFIQKQVLEQRLAIAQTDLRFARGQQGRGR